MNFIEIFNDESINPRKTLAPRRIKQYVSKKNSDHGHWLASPSLSMETVAFERNDNDDLNETKDFAQSV